MSTTRDAILKGCGRLCRADDPALCLARGMCQATPMCAVVPSSPDRQAHHPDEIDQRPPHGASTMTFVPDARFVRAHLAESTAALEAMGRKSLIELAFDMSDTTSPDQPVDAQLVDLVCRCCLIEPSEALKYLDSLDGTQRAALKSQLLR